MKIFFVGFFVVFLVGLGVEVLPAWDCLTAVTVPSTRMSFMEAAR
jgi:hypothetical protein